MQNKLPLVIILGSGASKPCGMPDTNELTNQIIQYSIGTIIQNETMYHVSQNKEFEWKPSTETWSMTGILWEALRGHYFQPNFETYIHALETLEPMAKSRRIPNCFGDMDDYKPVIAAFSDILTRYEPFMREEILKAERLDVTRRILEFLNLRLISLEYQNFRKASNLMLKKLLANFNASILTLNYDDLIDELIDEEKLTYFDGFSRQIKRSNAFSFDYADFSRKQNNSILLHLHGSVRFGYYISEKVENPHIVKFPSRAEAMKSIIESIESLANRGSSTSGGALRAITPIISGFQKADKLMLSPIPFGYYYHSAINHILQNNRILVAGYGCGDIHVNTWVHEAAQFHGDNYRMVFVTNLEQPKGRYTTLNDKQRNNMSTPERRLIDNFLSSIEHSTRAAWHSSGEDVIEFGRVMVIRSGMPLSDEKFEAACRFLAPP